MEYVRMEEAPRLRNPVLVAAFSGWNDAAGCASSAVRLLIERWHAQKFADIDPEEFYDFSVHRPRVRLDEDLVRELEWPANEFFFAELPDQQRDFILFVGQEPSLKWRTYTSAVSSVATELGVTDCVLAGALITDVVHTIPVRVTGSSNDADLRERMRLMNVSFSRYEGPTGIVGAQLDRFLHDGLRALSLWAAVPHYIPTTPNPKVIASLLRHMRDLVGFELDMQELDMASRRFEEQVTNAVNANSQLRDYVAERERNEREEQSDQFSRVDDFPSGETVVQSLEEFLRQNRPRPSEN